jgi:uncharacterized protein (TIGR03086 family)
MTETIADRYRRRAALVTEVISSVPAERWAEPSPCEGWTARDVVAHLVDTQALFAGFIAREPAEGPDVADDPLGAWEAARARTQALLDDPSTATTEFDGMTGRSSFEDAADRFLSLDLVVHRWDLARAVGADDTIPPEDVAALDAALQQMAASFGDAMRQGGAFGPELTPPEGADAQTRVLAFAGRRAW